jgi:hypothetical protein
VHISVDITIMASYTRATRACLGISPHLFLMLAH